MTLRRGWLQGNSGVRQLPSWRLFKARFQHFSVLMGRRDILLPLRQSQVNANQVVFVETVHKHSAVTTLNWKLQLQSEMDMFHCWSQFLQNVLCGGFLSLTRIRSEKFFLTDLPKSWLLGEFKINYPKIYTWSIKKKVKTFLYSLISNETWAPPNCESCLESFLVFCTSALHVSATAHNTHRMH